MVKDDVTVTQFVLPPVDGRVKYTGYTTGLAHDDDIKLEVEDWCQSNLSPKKGRIPSAKIGLEYISYIYPASNHRETFVLLAEFLTFLFAYDDDETVAEVDNPEKSFDRAIHIFEGRLPGTTHNEKLMSYFGDELRKQLSETTMNRMTLGMEQWIRSMKQELDISVKGNSLKLEEYLQFREDNGGTLIITTLGEALLHLDTSKFINESYISPVYQAAANHLALVNDLYSFRKEYYDKEMKANALYVLTKNHGLSFQDAVNRCGTLIQDYESKFISCSQTALISCDPSVKDDLQLYLDILSDMMVGNIHYSQLTSRYHGKKNQQRINHGLVMMDPDQTLFTPY